MTLNGTYKIEITSSVKGNSCWSCCYDLAILIDVAIVKICLAYFSNSVASGKIEN